MCENSYSTIFVSTHQSKKNMKITVGPDSILPFEPGTIIYLNKQGQLHNQRGPSQINPNGDKYWYKNGKLHRIGAPAVEERYRKEWYVNGKLHRTDGPAVIDDVHHLEHWFLNGEPHRDENDLPAYIDSAQKIWNKNGRLHRVGGPAIIFNDGSQEIWYFEGSYHRDDGPAVICGRHKLWYYHGTLCLECRPINTPETRIAKNLTIEQQEFIIRNRPDLIGQIPDLHKKIKEKYSYELSLAGIDI